jgi:hypothetical protein
MKRVEPAEMPFEGQAAPGVAAQHIPGGIEHLIFGEGLELTAQDLLFLGFAPSENVAQ